jgi:Tol biopolymer transport system component
LKVNAGNISVGKPSNITKRAGYDNQPSFTQDGKKLLYTQQADGQTDIWTYDVGKKTNTTLTKTTESEYSATVMPDGKHFSVIRVEPDGTQRLWQFDLATGQNPKLVLPSIKPVGYHCWFGADSLVLFVLGGPRSGQPNTLQLARVSTNQGQAITTNVGRSLLRIPSQKAVSFVHKLSATEWQVESLDMSTLQTKKLIQTPVGSEDCAWTGRWHTVDGAGS